MMKKSDLRVLHTRKSIKDAFLHLVETKGFDPITIQDISDQAQINRAMFYLHYDDKYDLLAKLTAEVSEELAQLIKPTSYVEHHEVVIAKLEQMIQNIFENIGQHDRFYQVMLGHHGIHGVKNQIQAVIKNNFSQEFLMLELQDDQLPMPIDLLVAFMTSALMGMIHWWIMNDQIYTPEHMSQNLVRIITRGPLEAMGLKIGAK